MRFFAIENNETGISIFFNLNQKLDRSTHVAHGLNGPLESACGSFSKCSIYTGNFAIVETKKITA